MYARMCRDLRNVEAAETEGGNALLCFRIALLKETQETFENLAAGKSWNAVTDSSQDKRSEMLRITRFVSELHNVDLLTDCIILCYCLTKLMPDKDDLHPDDTKTECFCLMLQRCAPKIKDEISLKTVFERLKKIVDAGVVSVRVQTLIHKAYCVVESSCKDLRTANAAVSPGTTAVGVQANREAGTIPPQCQQLQSETVNACPSAATAVIKTTTTEENAIDLMLMLVINTDAKNRDNTMNQCVVTLQDWSDDTKALIIKKALIKSVGVNFYQRERLKSFLAAPVLRNMFSQEIFSNGWGQVVELTDSLAAVHPAVFQHLSDVLAGLILEGSWELRTYLCALFESPDHISSYYTAFQAWMNAKGRVSQERKAQLYCRDSRLWSKIFSSS